MVYLFTLFIRENNGMLSQAVVAKKLFIN